MLRILTLLFVLALCAPTVRAQSRIDVPRDARGSRAAERDATIDANRVALTVSNTGLSGGFGNVRGNWPIGSNDFYLGNLVPVIGAEVVGDNGQTVRIVQTPRSPRAGTNSPPSNPNVFWGFEAVPGYAAETSESWARSDDATTWPVRWPNRAGDASDPGWPGLLGRDVFIDGTEFYGLVSDDANEEFAYTPDPEAPERGGVGLVVEHRVLAWRDPLLRDALVYVYDVWNASPKPLPQVAFGMVAGTLAGGDGDSGDDCARFYPDRDYARWYDFDDSGNEGQPVGQAALAFLDTPAPGDARGGMNGAFYFTPPGALLMNNDERLWDELTAGGDRTDGDRCRSMRGVDGDLLLSAPVFGLEPLSNRRVATALVFDETPTGIARKVDVLRGFVRNGFRFSGGREVALLAPEVGQAVAPGEALAVSWSAPGPGTLRAYVLLSRDLGQTWSLLADTSNTGSYTVSAQQLDAFGTGVYRLRVVVAGPDGVGAAESELFTVEAVPNVAPQVRVLAPQVGALLSGEATVSWESADANGDPVSIRIEYRSARSGWGVLAEGLTASGSFEWDTERSANGTFWLRVGASDGSETSFAEVGPVTIDNRRLRLDPGEIAFSGGGTGSVQVNVVSQAALTGDAYRLTFRRDDAGALLYDVANVTRGTNAVSGADAAEPEGPVFDGLRVVVRSDPAEVDTARTGYVQGSQGEPLLVQAPFEIPQFRLAGTPRPFDYEIRFGEPSESIERQLGARGPVAPAVQTSFSVVNTTTGEPAPFAFLEAAGTQNGDLDANAFATEALFVYHSEADTLAPVMAVRTDAEARGAFAPPPPGAVYIIRTRKEFAPGDVFTFRSGTVVSREPATARAALAMEPPRPLPAAGSTTLVYTLPGAGTMRLTLYDATGREAVRVAEGNRSEGTHVATVNTGRLASGVYLIRLEWNGQALVRPLVVSR